MVYGLILVQEEIKSNEWKKDMSYIHSSCLLFLFYLAFLSISFSLYHHVYATDHL